MDIKLKQVIEGWRRLRLELRALPDLLLVFSPPKNGPSSSLEYHNVDHTLDVLDRALSPTWHNSQKEKKSYSSLRLFI